MGRPVLYLTNPSTNLERRLLEVERVVFDDDVVEAPRVVSASIISEYEVMLTYNVPVTYDGPVYGGSFTVRKNGELINYSGLQGTVINDGPQTGSPVGTKVVIDLTGWPNGSLTPADEILVKNAYPERFVSGGTTDNGNGVDVVGIPSETQFVSLTDGVTVTGDPASGVMLIEPLGGIRVLDDGRVLLGSVAPEQQREPVW